MEQFALRLRRAAQLLQYNDDMIKDQFISGLPENIQIAVGIAGPQNLQNTISTAQRYVDMTGSREVGFTLPSVDDVSSSMASLDVQERPSRDSYRSSRGRQRHRHRSRSRDSYRGRSGSRDTYRGRSSSAGNYKKGRSPTPGRTTGKTCDYCGIRNHLWRQCRKLAREMKDGKVKWNRKDF